MHSYLRAIGFSKLEQKDLDQILQEVIVSCDEKWNIIFRILPEAVSPVRKM